VEIGDGIPNLKQERVIIGAPGRFLWLGDATGAIAPRPPFRLVVREGVRADDALDCVQEAFLSFLQLPQARLLVGSPVESARLLSTLARNIARNRRRRHDYAKPHVVDEEILQNLPLDAISSDEVVIRAEQHALALGCLVTLNEVQQAVVNLRLVDEVPGEDVALQLGTTREHVRVLLFRARQYLQRCLSDHHERSLPQAGTMGAPVEARASKR
jgi:RNA polymerase sigma-70 factor (ECF subfamily)